MRIASTGRWSVGTGYPTLQLPVLLKLPSVREPSSTSPLRPVIFIILQPALSARLNLTPLINPSVFVCSLIHHNHLYPTFCFIGRYLGESKEEKKIMICIN